MQEIKPKPVFINTKNVRNFQVAMNIRKLFTGEGYLVAVSGASGLGKTETTQRWAAENDAVYMRMQKVWRTSELPFLQAMYKEVGLHGNPPHRKAVAFASIVEECISRPRPIILDEIEKLSGLFLEVIRDLSDLAYIPVILVGEDELLAVMRRNSCVWNRTLKHIAFGPMEPKDIIIYCFELTGQAIRLKADMAALIHKKANGVFRIVRNCAFNLIDICNTRKTNDVTEEMATIAIKQALMKDQTTTISIN